MKAVKIIKPEYVFLKLKPNNAIRNQNTHKIAKSINSVYKNVIESMKREESKLIKVLGRKFLIGTKYSLEARCKVAYYIYIEKQKVEFYFIVPKQHYGLLKERMTDVWQNLTIEKVDTLPIFGESATAYHMVYEKEDALSLAIDRRSNELLNSTLNIVDALEVGDKVGIFYNFIPASQFSWRSSYRHTMDKVKHKQPLDRNKFGMWYGVKLAVSVLANTFNVVGEVLGGENEKAKGDRTVNLFERALERVGGKGVSDATMKKAAASILHTQIVALSESKDELRQRNNARSLVQCFETISEDNRLLGRMTKLKFKFTDHTLAGVEVNKMGDEECQNFLSLAGRDILERYNFIEKVETHETEVPEDLRSGVMCIGDNKFRGKLQKAYLSNDFNLRNLLLLLIGPTRAGKSNLIANLSVDAIEAGECVIIFDFIQNCELSGSVAALFPKAKVLEIRCDDFKNLQGLGYNEVGRSEDVFKQYENAKRQTANMLTLVDSINTDESRLSPKMSRYLESASLVVFISNGSIKDVFGVLQNHKTRHEFLKKVPAIQKQNLEEYMESLLELDDTDKHGVIIGTNTNLIVGIIDRLSILKRNTYLELMLKKGTAGNVDLITEMQKSQLIVIKMPQNMFTTDSEKDIVTTYWITKIWLSLQVRADRIREEKKRTKVNLVIDELYQVANTERFLTSKLSQIAKFTMKPIVSCHYINQLKYMRDELRSANASYMLISGCDKKNYDELKSELYPFADEDLRNLPRYHSMNYVKDKVGYSRFITQLPGEVEKRVKGGS